MTKYLLAALLALPAVAHGSPQLNGTQISSNTAQTVSSQTVINTATVGKLVVQGAASVAGLQTDGSLQVNGTADGQDPSTGDPNGFVTVNYGNVHYSPGGWTCAIRTSACTIVNNGGATFASISCSGNEKAISGGVLGYSDSNCTSASPSTYLVVQNAPNPSGQGWSATANAASGTTYLKVVANCCQ